MYTVDKFYLLNINSYNGKWPLLRGLTAYMEYSLLQSWTKLLKHLANFH